MNFVQVVKQIVNLPFTQYIITDNHQQPYRTRTQSSSRFPRCHVCFHQYQSLDRGAVHPRYLAEHVSISRRLCSLLTRSSEASTDSESRHLRSLVFLHLHLKCSTSLCIFVFIYVSFLVGLYHSQQHNQQYSALSFVGVVPSITNLIYRPSLKSQSANPVASVISSKSIQIFDPRRRWP